MGGCKVKTGLRRDQRGCVCVSERERSERERERERIVDI